MIRKNRVADRRDRLDPETEELLWQLSGLPSRALTKVSRASLDEDQIERYRQRDLPAEESRRFEEQLASDERAMERLAQLAEAKVVAKPAVVQQPALRLAASILVGALATTGLFYYLRTGAVETTTSAIPPYTIEVQGLADRRGSLDLVAGTERAAKHETMSGSTVRIVARPAKASGSDPRFALYRNEAGTLVKIPEATDRIHVNRGTAVLEAEAGTLVGTAPGLYELVLLIGSREFTAPRTIASSGLHELRAQPHSFELRLLPTPSPWSREP